MYFERDIKATYEDYRLFHNLWNRVNRELRVSEEVDEEDIEIAVNRLKNPFRDGQENSDFSKIDFNEVANCCAYLERFATCHTSLTKFVIEEYFREGQLEEFFDLLVNEDNDSLSVLSLAGGPGNDAIGFCKALTQRPAIRNIDVCVTDLWPYWRTVQKEMLNVIAGDHANVFGDINVSFEFLRSDLTSRTPSPELLQRIGIADVILMVKVISILKDEDKERVLQMVLSNMKEEAALVYIDTQQYRLSDMAVMPHFEILYTKPRRRYILNCNCGYCVEHSSFDVCIVYKRVVKVTKK